MAIITDNKHIQYDLKTHQYCFTPEAVLNFLPYSDDELARRVKNYKDWISFWGRNMYDFILSTNMPKMKKYIEYKIFLNIENEVQAIIDASVKYVFEVMENEVDISGIMPESVKRILSNANLLYQGYFDIEIDDVVYGVDY